MRSLRMRVVFLRPVHTEYSIRGGPGHGPGLERIG